MEEARENYDDDIWDLNEEAIEQAKLQLTHRSFCNAALSLASAHFEKPVSLVRPLQLGGYNMLYRVRVEGLADDVLVRVPCPGCCQFPEEKTAQEAATALLLARETLVPVPPLLFSKTTSEIGPFIMLPYVENKGDVTDLLSLRRASKSQVPVLDEDMDIDRLQGLFTKIAEQLLQLWQPTFPRIGSLRETAGGKCLVRGRPVTLNMSNMVQLANIPRPVLPLPDTTYKSADAWYLALAEMHFAQLVFQHNDLVTSADDCRNKYIARHLFRKLARQRQLSVFGFADDTWSAQSKSQSQSRSQSGTCSAPPSKGPFRLWCDDLRPDNFLVDAADDIIAAIDWEFTYAAPTNFILDPPWWLLLLTPEMWPAGLRDWAVHFERQLGPWLAAMEMAETTTATTAALPFKVSRYMRESWATGRFWLNYAARKSWAFDAIYWTFLDVRFFGPRKRDTSTEHGGGDEVGDVGGGGVGGGVGVGDEPYWKARVNMLSHREKTLMNTFVEQKMKDIKERRVVSWDAQEARRRLAEVLAAGDDDGYWSSLYQAFVGAMQKLRCFGWFTGGK